jgi:transketolase
MLGKINQFDYGELKILSLALRKGIFEICLNANNGHIGGSSAAVELFISLYFGNVLNFNPSNYNDPCRDRVLVRGHLGPLRYKMFSWLGWIEEEELSGYRRIGSRLPGHEDHLVTPGVDITPSGSLGMVLSYGVGSALGARDSKREFQTFVFIGDGEEQEGVVSEAARHASHLNLGNLTAIIDTNGKQLSNPINEVDTANVKKIWEGYGWIIVEIENGHDIKMIIDAYKEASVKSRDRGKPTLIIAKTIKGIGISGAEDHFSGFHTMGRVTNEAVQEGIDRIDREIDQGKLEKILKKIHRIKEKKDEKSYSEKKYQSVSLDFYPSTETPNHPDECQFDYFRNVKKKVEKGELNANDMYFLTADVTTKEVVASLKIEEMFHFHNVGIREQHMVAMAHGLSVVRPEARILINSFDAFNYRCLDQINCALQGKGRMIIIGDVAGITNSRNGKTHQTTSLPIALLSMDDLTFLEPWNAIDTFNCLNWAIGESEGIVYIRIHSSEIKHVPDKESEYSIKYYVVRNNEKNPDIVLIGVGIGTESCIEAADKLKEEGVVAKVINVVNLNELDSRFVEMVKEDVPVITVYNGSPSVLRQIVADSVLRNRPHRSIIYGLGFTKGNTGTFEEMLSWAQIRGIDVFNKAKEILK